MSSTLLYQRDKLRLIAALISVLVASSAFLLRAPSCYESFWLDELHSAWCIWDGFSDVEPRASAGHQTPLFYWMLWIWKQLIGDTEFALRMISVAAVSLASGLASYVIATSFRSIAAGFTAGMVLAIEENSIFFGTELRPYALIILLSTIVVLGYLRVLSSEELRQQKSARLSIFISAFAAVSIQVTSAAIVLIFAFLSQMKKKEFRQKDEKHLPPKKWLGYGLSFIILGGVVTMNAGIADSWRQRGLWQSFGTSESVAQVGSIWQWNWLLGIPVSISFIALVTSGMKHSWSHQAEIIRAIITLSLIVVMVTVAFWMISYPPIAPLWHRRYFIGLLPVFSALMGLSILLLERLHKNAKDLSLAQKCLLHPWALSFLMLTGLAWSQNTLPRIHHYPIAYAKRGEDWRAAMKYISSISSPSDSLWLAPGLIEETLYQSDSLESEDETRGVYGTISLKSYLLYPSFGPYAIETKFQLWQDRGKQQSGQGRDILLSRTPAHRFSKNLRVSNQLKSFGNVTVITLNQNQ